MITDEVCRSVAEYGISHGADFVEIFGEHDLHWGVPNKTNYGSPNILFSNLMITGTK